MFILKKTLIHFSLGPREKKGKTLGLMRINEDNYDIYIAHEHVHLT